MNSIVITIFTFKSVIGEYESTEFNGLIPMLNKDSSTQVCPPMGRLSPLVIFRVKVLTFERPTSLSIIDIYKYIIVN